MIHKDQIAKMAKRILHPQRRARDIRIIHPQREWVIGLLVAITIFAVSAVWSAQTYMTYRDVTVDYSNQEESAANVYRAEMVTAALDEFTSRQQGLDVLIATVPEPVPENTATTTEEAINGAEDAEQTETATTTSDVQEEVELIQTEPIATTTEDRE